MTLVGLDEVHEFPAGHYYTPKDGFVQYYKIPQIEDHLLTDVEETCKLITDGNLLNSYAITWMEVTDYKALINSLKRDNDWVRRSFDTAEVMLVSVNRNDEVTNINTHGCRLLEYSKSEIIGKNFV